MTPSEILLFSQLASLIVQGLTSLINARKQLGTNASQTDTANLAQAHANFQSIIAEATAAAGSPAA
jgi:hypothetical protein